MNVIQAIRNFFPQRQNGDYIAEFPGDMKFAREFAEGIRAQLIELGISKSLSYEYVIQSNTNVYIKLPQESKNDPVTSDSLEAQEVRD